MTSRAHSPLLRSQRPSRATGVLVAVACVAASTVVIYPLEHVTPVLSLGVVYLLGVVVMSIFWGLAFGVATAVLSAAAFSFFHLPPVGRFTLADSRNWIGLSAFVVVAAATGFVAELARARAQEADQRRREADLAAELARLLLGATRLEDALPVAARHLAAAVGVVSASIELNVRPLDQHHLVLPLERDGLQVGALVLPTTLSDLDRSWVLQRVVPSLASILAAALHRAELQAEVVETAALRRSDEMKTAVLRSVSHDLRTPVTAILTAVGALDPELPTRENVGEVRDLVMDAATRLWLLIEKLLDLSLLQAGQLEPHLGWCSIEEVLHEAVELTRGDRELFQLSVDRDLPLLRGDAAQLERAFVNVMENAARYSAGKPVSVRARAVGGRVRVRVVDQGPGIPSSEHERVFLPFYRSADGRQDHHGSGLGLAIAKGFIEVNSGRISVESVPGQGTSFVVEFPIARDDISAAPAGAAQPVGG
jgi:two-component system sensor histidine kinase KdpD